MSHSVPLRMPLAVRQPLWQTVRAGLVPAPAVLHAARAVVAALLALWVAYELELPSPSSAAITVLIVAHPVHGMVLSKSLNRLAGTLVGAAVGVGLMAGFAQQPEMFIVALSLWMGLCTTLSSVLRNFRSYGAVLAGYTVVLIVLPIVDTPQDTFTAAVNRVSVVAVGIACSAVVASLTTVRSSRRTLEGRLAACLAALADYVRMALWDGDADAMTGLRRKLAADLSGLDALAEYAAVEAGELNGATDALRSAVTAIFGAMTIATSTHGALARQTSAGWPNRLLDDIHPVILRLAGAAAAGPDGLDQLRSDLVQLGSRVEAELDARDRSRLAVLDRLGELLDELAHCVDALATLAGGSSPAPAVTWRRHIDWTWAAMNGLRATVTVWLAGVLWIASAWPSGALMLSMVVPNVGLLSLRSRPVSDAAGFFWGGLLASVVGFAFLLFVLPEIDGFPLLAFSLAPILFAGVLLSIPQRTAFIGAGFYVCFLTLLAPSNPMVYDPQAFLSNALAIVAGVGLTAVVYRLFLPADPRRQVRALVRAIQADVAGLAAMRGSVARATWEARMHDRLVSLGSHMRAAGVAQDGLLRGGFAALRIGREILRLRDLSAEYPAGAVIRPVLRQLQAFAERPQRAVLAADQAAHRLLDLAADEPGPVALAPLRAAASLTEIAILLGRHRRFFQLTPRR